MTSQPTPAQIRDLMPFAALIGIELEEASRGLVCGTLAWAPELCSTAGIMHGGALMALADTCGGMCAFLNIPDGLRGTATVQSATSFLRAVCEGIVTARTRPVHTGRTLVVLETELTREDGSLVAKLTQTQALLP